MGSERYGDLILAPVIIVDARHKANVMDVREGCLEGCKGMLVVARTASVGNRRNDGRGWAERDRRWRRGSALEREFRVARKISGS